MHFYSLVITQSKLIPVILCIKSYNPIRNKDEALKFAFVVKLKVFHRLKGRQKKSSIYQ